MKARASPASSAREVGRVLEALADPDIAAHSARFFKTGSGEYGHGDVFLGIRVPTLRKKAREYRSLPLGEVAKLLTSRFHEVRLCALLILVLQYDAAPAPTRSAIYELYLASTRHINNWDLVDTSAHRIVGPELASRSRRPLRKLAASAYLWERRIAIMATLHFIKLGQFDDTLELAARLIDDEEDLIHKAVGWMLREVGNRDRAAEEAFLRRHYERMPRTMLRYAIEKFPERLRKQYLAGTV